MKKIFTICAGLLLGASAFQASALEYEGVTFSQPTATTLQVTWAVGSSLTVQSDAINGYIKATVSGNGVEKDIPYSAVTEKSTYAENSYLSFNIAGLELADGDYTFTLPADYVKVTTYVSGATDPGFNQEMSFDFTVGGSFTPVEYSIKYQQSDNIINITWETPTGQKAVLSDLSTDFGAEIINSDDMAYSLTPFDELEGNYSTQNIRISDDVLKVNFTNGNLADIIESGDYTLYIPAAYLKVNGEDSPAIEYEFSYTAPWEEGYVRAVVEYNELEETYEVQVTWTEADVVEGNSSFSPMFGGLQIYGGDDEAYEVPANSVVYYDNSMIIPFTAEQVAPGDCRVVVPAGFVKVTKDGETNENSDQSVDFSYFSDIELMFMVMGDPENVTISYFDRSKFEDVVVTEESVTVPGGTTFEIKPAPGYQVDVWDMAPYAYAVSAPDDLAGSWYISVVNPPVDTYASIMILVNELPASFQLNFVSENPAFNSNEYQYVEVEGLEVNDDVNSYYIFEGETSQFTLAAVEGYEIASVTFVQDGEVLSLEEVNALEDCSVFVEGGVYSFELSPAAKNLVITVEVEVYVETVGITIDFSGEDLDNDAYTYVYVMSDAINRVNVDSDNYVYDVPAAQNLNLTFVPVEGYLIEVTCTTADGQSYGDVLASDTNNNVDVQVALEEGEELPEGLKISVVVSVDPNYSGINSINKIEDDAAIYNLNGVKVNKNNMGSGIFIINGKKVVVKK